MPSARSMIDAVSQLKWFDPGSVEEVSQLVLKSRSEDDDQFLYHYTSAEKLVKHILPEGRLLLGRYATMNDPHENRDPSLVLEYSKEPGAEHLNRAEVEEELAAIRGQMRVLSLTMDAADYERPENASFARGYARSRMWEQYGHAHRGACLAFSSSCLIDSFYERLRDGGAPTCGPVTYTEAGLAGSPARVIQADGLTLEDAATPLTKHVMEHHQEFWFLKQLDWESEYEYRIVKFDPGIAAETPLLVPFGPCLAAIILGEFFDPDAVELVKGLAAPLGAGVFRLNWQGGWPQAIRV